MSLQTWTRLINRKHVRYYALAAANHRPHRFTRVGEDFLVKAEAGLKEFIRNYVAQLPSTGNTIR